MLGSFVRGMQIKIPARFQNNDGKPVVVENVVVRIEHFDPEEKKVVHDLPETPMTQLSQSDYVYNYTIPQALKEGTYLVHISAKVPQSGNKVFEALEQFNITTSQLQPINPDVIEKPRITSVSEVDSSFDNTNNYNSNNNNNSEKIMEDIVVDVENNPVKGVHVNVFVRKDFIPNDINNMKVSSAMTDEQGKWTMTLPLGEYVFVYKGIGFKETRELRKV